MLVSVRDSYCARNSRGEGEPREKSRTKKEKGGKRPVKQTRIACEERTRVTKKSPQKDRKNLLVVKKKSSRENEVGKERRETFRVPKESAVRRKCRKATLHQDCQRTMEASSTN